MLPSIERLAARADIELKRAFDKVTDLLGVLVKVPFLDGVLISDVAATTGGTTVNHGLSRMPRGVLVIYSDSGLVFSPKPDWTTKTLKLVAYPVNSNVTVWVF